MKEQLYIFRWGNNPQRAEMKGRKCKVLCRGSMNSCGIEFIDNGETACVSRNALRKSYRRHYDRYGRSLYDRGRRRRLDPMGD
jgi:hypothetical protein